jgi:hypothetical protein
MLHGLAPNIQSFITMFMGLTIFHIIFPTFKLNVKMFREILSVPKNTLMDLNNVMLGLWVIYLCKVRSTK